MRVYEVTCIRKRKQKSQMTEEKHQTQIYSHIYNKQYTDCISPSLLTINDHPVLSPATLQSPATH